MGVDIFLLGLQFPSKRDNSRTYPVKPGGGAQERTSANVRCPKKRQMKSKTRRSQLGEISLPYGYSNTVQACSDLGKDSAISPYHPRKGYWNKGEPRNVVKQIKGLIWVESVLYRRE